MSTHDDRVVPGSHEPLHGDRPDRTDRTDRVDDRDYDRVDDRATHPVTDRGADGYSTSPAGTAGAVAPGAHGAHGVHEAQRDHDERGYETRGGLAPGDRADEDRDLGAHERPGAVATGAAAAGAVSARSFGTDRESVVAREREAFGGIKIGSAFFGWLTATGTAVLLSALLAGIGAAVGVATESDLQEASDDPAGVGLAGAITLLVIMFLAYFCGGYVAGRMARFNGAKQGLAVWLWAVVIAVLVVVVGFAAGSQFDDLAQASLPNLPLNGEALTTAGIATAVGVAVVSLVGAILGGLAGMRFHRKVDRAGLGA